MNRALTLKLLSSNHELVQALLAERSAIACAEVTVPIYPFPCAEHPSWTTAAGKIVAALAEEHDMSIPSMHASPSAAAVVLFPAKWRCMARKLAEKRVLRAKTAEELVEALIVQYRSDNCCDRATAILQLAAARVASFAHEGVAAFLSYTDDGCNICTTVDDVLSPDCASLITLQEELNCAEQLVYIILRDELSDQYRRLSSGQPLALARPQLMTNCLALCQQCTTNWAVDADGTTSRVMVCRHPGCLRMVHSTCWGRSPAPVCPQHGVYIEVNLAADISGRVVCARGLEAKNGAWHVQLANWGNTDGIIGSLHPNSIALVVADTDLHIDQHRWSVSQASIRASRRFTERIDTLHRLSHLHLTHTMPLKLHDGLSHEMTRDLGRRRYPLMRGMGQMPSTGIRACRLSHGVAHTLRLLQVYSEPSFSRMLDRFMQLQGHHIDDLVLMWMKHGMPLLSGEYATCPGDARVMHKQVYNVITSPKTMERAMAAGRDVRHWASAQPDAVLPRSEAEEKDCFVRLGVLVPCPSAAPRLAPAASPDVESTTAPRPRAVPGVYTTFAVRLMMNPSLYQETLARVLDDSGADVDIRHFQQREVDPLGPVLQKADVRAFRAACIQSSAYGKVYLWLLEHGTTYTTSDEQDTTGMLPAWRTSDEQEPPRRWQAVADLCTCTDAAYVDMGCGSMAYWQRVVMNDRPSYVFETSLEALQELGLSSAPNTVHVIPCSWKDLCLSELGCRRAVVVARRDAPRAGSVEAHYLLHAPDDTCAVSSGAIVDSAWTHRVTDAGLGSEAAYASRIWTAMRG